MLALAPSGAGTSIVPMAPVVWNKESILFSACNEDSRSELRALEPLEGRSVFCVTAGGGRVLNLLLGRPKSIIAVDLNPAQSALLELKIAAMRELDHDGYLRFLGVREDFERLATYGRVRARLSETARSFFDRHAAGIDAGVLYHGRLERYFKGVSAVTRLAQPFGLRKVFEAPNLAAQRSLVKRLESPIWRFVGETLCRRSVLRLFSGDPGFFRYLPPDLPLHQVLYGRIHEHLRENLFRENSLLQLVFFGRYVWEPSLPIYLHADTFSEVKDALEQVRIEIVTATVEDALAAAGQDRFDAFSLSDISSYLDDNSHHRLFERLLETAKKDARVCSRSNIRHRPLAAEHAGRIRRADSQLEQELALRDHACVHEFLVGAIS